MEVEVITTTEEAIKEMVETITITETRIEEVVTIEIIERETEMIKMMMKVTEMKEIKKTEEKDSREIKMLTRAMMITWPIDCKFNSLIYTQV